MQCQNILSKFESSKAKSNYIYYHLFEVRLDSIVRNELVTKFWSHFPKDDEVSHIHTQFVAAIEFLSEACCDIDNSLVDPVYESLKKKFYLALKTQILFQKPHQLERYLKATYLRGFKVFLMQQKVGNQATVTKSDNDSDDMDEDEAEDDDDEFDRDGQTCGSDDCHGCQQKLKFCECLSIYERFNKMNEYLRNSNLLEGLVGDTVMTVAKKFIERKVSSKCKSNYSRSYLHQLTIWVHDVVKQWVLEVYGAESSDDSEYIEQKLDRFLKDAYAEVRVSHMFEIVIEYPNSEAAIQDLKMCLELSTSSQFRLNLINSVKQSLIESLLHPGVNTYDILTAYISAIKALRALDPTGLILQLVTEPVRRYLKSRDDTVRCIVTALTDEDHNSELNREMIRSSNQTNENGTDAKSGTIEMSIPSEGEKCTALNFEKWKPDPIKLNASDDLMKSSRFSDIVSILVNIYETKDLFVEEYQKLLSQRLLNKYDECNLDTELRNLELLTIRFSDCELHRCEVMLKDVQTSKRINKRILSGDIRDHKLEEFKNLDVLIVSSPFWPDKFSPMVSLSDEPPEITFPPAVETAISTYTKAFEAIQASRTLHWRHHLGSVNLDVTVGGKTQNFSVSPLHAAVLYSFKERKAWRLKELMHKTSLPAATLRSRLALWQRNGLIRDCGGDKYELIEQ